MRIVIDTNIWIAGLLWRGPAERLLRCAEKGKLTLCMAYQMVLELEEVLAYERLQPRLSILGQTPAQLAAYALSLSSAFSVRRTGTPIVAADPDDDIFLLCAMEASASYVVTHDKHLLTLKSFEGISIVSLEDFMNLESALFSSIP